MPGGPTAQSIQANFQTWLSGSQTTGLIILEHELSDAAVQTFEAAFPLIKQYNWNLKSVATLDGKGAYQNAPDDTSGPILVPLTAAGNGGAGLIAATSTSTSSTPPPPSSTSSAGSKPSAHPGSGAKTGGAALGSKSSPIMLSISTLALVFSLCLI
jgi:chitin deacetylase